ncbi:GDSL esterase/lipase At5g33370-like [Cynara cardunculus var. scolymus]|uniref:GDSL esterase/lipase At5g33370-like n=1 Tax=Cynara cardunculus var. scolymus TaxID=59895 RepID=UPI000D627B53|nr:GDSL esterase/lipase At5g33370-like [Cynara cardunculus var. scolymus]
MSCLPVVSIFIFLYFGLVFGAEKSPTPKPKVETTKRAFFVFGDSLVDNGNNNFLATSARADSPPYGIDYPSHRPTGRFSNGYNIPDLIGQRIGIDLLLPYLDPTLTGQKLLNGANFASAGIGILNDTGVQFVNIIRMPSQLQDFEKYQRRVTDLIGAEKTKKLINDALVLITCGGNDFVNNYYLVPNSLRSIQFKLPEYVTFLISEYQKILMRLYELGARKVIVTGTGPLGCVPAILALRSKKGECAPDLQQAAELFNPQLVDMVNSLNKKLGNHVFVTVETNYLHMNFINNPKAFGFETATDACCGQGPYNGLGLCTVLSNLCPNRETHVFWDGYHPSERANRLIVQEIFNGSMKYVKPLNLSTLMALDFIEA